MKGPSKAGLRRAMPAVAGILAFYAEASAADDALLADIALPAKEAGLAARVPAAIPGPGS